MISSTPVTVLAGFLGSGKSTLLNHLLKSGELPPTAIVINEFGEVAIDNALVEGVTEGVSLLSAGCVCCAVRSDLEATLRDLIIKRTRGVISHFEAVIVEMSGLAEPGPVLQTVASQPMRQLGYVLGPVVATFDALHGLISLERYHEARQQVALADRIIITKPDLAHDLRPAKQALAHLNPAADVRIAKRGELAPDWAFGRAPGLAGSIVDVHHAHEHAHGLNSAAVWFNHPLDWEPTQSRIRKLLREQGRHILRLKGLLNLDGVDHPIAIHAVHHTLYPPEQLQAWPDADQRSRIVIIAEGAVASEIAQALELDGDGASQSGEYGITR